MWEKWLEQNAVLGLLIGLGLGGVIGGLALFAATWLYSWHTRPILRWGTVRVRRADLPPIYPESGSVGFYSSMVAVYNKGKTAAQNCMGHIEIEGNREHICWFLPAERRAMTINCADFEFLEVCGVQDEYVPAIGLDSKPSTRIAPTENGWQPAGSNRNLGSAQRIRAKVIVSASNATPIELPIVIIPLADLVDPEVNTLFMAES